MLPHILLLFEFKTRAANAPVAPPAGGVYRPMIRVRKR